MKQNDENHLSGGDAALPSSLPLSARLWSLSCKHSDTYTRTNMFFPFINANFKDLSVELFDFSYIHQLKSQYEMELNLIDLHD